MAAAEDAGPPKKLSRLEALKAKFALFDVDNDGSLTRDEIRAILTRPTGDGGVRKMNIKMAEDVREPRRPPCRCNAAPCSTLTSLLLCFFASRSSA